MFSRNHLTYIFDVNFLDTINKNEYEQLNEKHYPSFAILSTGSTFAPLLKKFLDEVLQIEVDNL